MVHKRKSKDLECEAKMEEDAQTPDWDSDETVIEGSVTDSDLEEEELRWRRLNLDQETSHGYEFSLHSDTPSPEIQVGFKLRKDPQKQQSQDKMEQNQVLLQTTECPQFTVSFSQPEFSQNHQNIQGPEAENSEVLIHSGKELNEDRESPEISLLSDTAITVSDKIAVNQKLLTEPERLLGAPNTFSKPGNEVISPKTFEETRDEESSLETFVSAIERLLPSPEITREERLFEKMSDFEPRELMNTLSRSSSSISLPLTCHGDLLENTNDDALPYELLAALNTLSEAQEQPICHRKWGGNVLNPGDKYLELDPNMSQTDEDCTQKAETIEDPDTFGLQNMIHQHVTTCDPLNEKRNSNPVENSSDQNTPCVLRRSSRLKARRNAEHTDGMYTVLEEILPKILDCKDQTNNSSAENFRMHDPTILIEGKEKNKNSSRLKSGELIRKNKKIAEKYEKMKMDKISLSTINRRNIFGENLVYRAALHNDSDFVRHCIKKGGNVNQRSYAGWTALHEASVRGFYQTASELLKGGADVNIKGMYQITPLHDAVMNGHYKVAELLLLNGADPLLRSDNGKCALDKAKDSRMKRLLERYVPKHQKHLTSAQKNSTDLLDVEDTHQHKKPKFSSKNCVEFICDEQSNRQKPEHVKVDNGSRESLFVSEEDIYEHFQEDSRNIRLGTSKHKQSTLNQKYPTELRKNNLRVKDPSTNVSTDKGRRNIQHKSTQVDDEIQENNPRKNSAVSSSSSSATYSHEQHILQTISDLPEESCKPSSSALLNLKNGLGNNIEICSVSKETCTQSLNSSDIGQEIKFLELGSTDQTEAIFFSGLSSHKGIELPLINTEQLPHTHKGQQQISHYKSYENSNLGQEDGSLSKREDSFPSFMEENFNGDNGDCCTSEITITSEKMVSSTAYKNHYNPKETITNRVKMDFQQFLLFEDHFSQENEFKSASLTKLPQQEAVNFSHSDNTIVSEEHVTNYEQYMNVISFDHSNGNPENTSFTCTKTLSTHEVSPLTGHVQLFTRTQDYSPRVPTPLMNQADTRIVEKVNKKEKTKRNYTDKGQKTSFSTRSLSTVFSPQVTETAEVEKGEQDLSDSNTIHNRDFHFTDSLDKKLTNISQHSQREEKECSLKPDEQLTNNTNEDESTVRNCEEKEEKIDSEIHMPTYIQGHKKIQNVRKRQNTLKTTYSQEVKAAGINKRNARGESRLHSAARRGNLSLVKVLIESGADVNLKDNAGWTPLHEASSEGSNDIIIELLKAGANVNCENLDGILPLHDAVANNHLKAAEILLQHGADPNQKDQNQKTALDEADDIKMEELLKSYGAIETDNRDETNAVVTEKIPAVRSKRNKQCFCDDCKTVDLSSLARQKKPRESHPVHQTISAILQDVEEKQENLLEFEIRTPEDAEQYIEKMLEIKEVMNSILAKQKAERDDLAKKYRVSIESFKHGVLREQLSNLATRQKSLLVVAKKQKKISLKIQNYKNITSLSDFSLRKLSSSSEISSENAIQELTSLENSVQPQSCSISPISLVHGNIQETQLTLEMRDSQNTSTPLNMEIVRRTDFPGNELNSKQDVNNCSSDGLSKSRESVGTKKIKLPSKPVAFTARAECSHDKITETIAKEHESCGPSSVTGTLNNSETASLLAQNDHSSTVICNQAFSNCGRKRMNRKKTSQQPSRGTSEHLAHRMIAALPSDTEHQIKPHFKKSAFSISHANDSQRCFSGSDPQHTINKSLNHSTIPKKKRMKRMQIKDLILLGRINPGNNILEFKTQETTHKASILLSGKIKVENGQIYQNPVTWLKDVLGSNSCVTWNYAWSKVTYLGKELLKYVSEEEPTSPELNLAPQQDQPCLPEISGESMQSIPHYLQINEILLISDQEFLPCHVMDQHWKFYVECEELTL
ncbi:ankyrin repeat domain-containing protein 31 [Talpa occidentalis]|uniref:ankyrin repeat domain-containing protein 31 n=1 Tax=Talpa occidentalis TaxID=50954 RepID=UPI00188F5D4E|nr:ankyrin repeat domain-containing protein 31 [Talpa occidentalis]